MTSLAAELQAGRAWPLAGGAHFPTVCDDFARREFFPADAAAEDASQRLGRLLRWATAQVPWYRAIFNGRGLTAADIAAPDDLVRLPVLSKLDVQQQADRLRAPALPPGERIIGRSRSSGTSGRRPTEVLMTASGQQVGSFIKQRELRWFRFDPRHTLAWVRLPSQMPPMANGAPLGAGATLRHRGWPGLQAAFSSGPFVGYSVLNPIEAQVAWLQQEQPTYLMAYAESLEHLALAWGERGAPAWLEGMLAISEQVTTGMRRLIEARFGAPLHENYGLNEIGVVATRCPEGGRFHVHTEANLVEIVDADGQPTVPGERGRVLVTALTNPAMPLIRYDTGDLAEPAEGPCPCGRSLPGFERIVGRYSRIAHLPPGTLELAGSVRETIEAVPEAVLAPLREFQLEQRADGGFCLRLKSTAELGAEFAQRVQAAFAAARAPHHGELEMVYVDAIERAPGGKFRDFVSAFEPDPTLDNEP